MSAPIGFLVCLICKYIHIAWNSIAICQRCLARGWLAACRVCVWVCVCAHAGVVENVNDVWAVSRPGRKLSDGVAWVTLLSINRPCVHGRQTEIERQTGRQADRQDRQWGRRYSLPSVLLVSLCWAKQIRAAKVKKTKKWKCEQRLHVPHSNTNKVFLCASPNFTTAFSWIEQDI